MQRTIHPATSDPVTSVFLVEADELTLAGLRLALDGAPDLAPAGEAGTVADAICRLPLADPDVVVVDVNLPDGCGTLVLSFLRTHGVRARRIALTGYADDPVVAHAVAAGADAVLTTRISLDQLTRAVQLVAAGRPLTDQRHRDRIDELARSTDHDEHLARLTHQEHVLLAHLARGLTNREIAETMGLSDKTVKNYVSSVMMKLEVSHRAAAAAYFARAEAQFPCVAHAPSNGSSVIRY
ncbi:MAG: LuxR C-terminal-related transcriptional regulator [Acidimicrobiia bacterium]